MRLTHLFSPLTLRSVEIRNRIFSTGHQANMLTGGLPNARLAAYHEARAAGGAGLIVIEAARIGCVPEDAAVIDSVHSRRPLVLNRPHAPAAAALRLIAHELLDGALPHGNTLSAFFSTAKALVAPRRRSSRSSCAL